MEPSVVVLEVGPSPQAGMLLLRLFGLGLAVAGALMLAGQRTNRTGRLESDGGFEDLDKIGTGPSPAVAFVLLLVGLGIALLGPGAPVGGVGPLPLG